MTALHQLLLASSVTAPVNLIFLGNATNGTIGQTSVSGNIDLGISGNLIIVVSTCSGVGTVGISNISVGGNTGAVQRILAQRANRGVTGIYTLAGAPTGVQSVTVTFDQAAAFGAVTVYSISGHSSMVPASTASDTTTDFGVAATLNVPAGGAVVGSAVGFGAGITAVSVQWNALSEDVDSIAGNSARVFGVAHASQQPGNASYDGGATISGSGTINGTGAWCVWK